MADAAPADAPPMDAPPQPRVVINELVLTPNHDWSGALLAYVGTPGTGSISGDDEWIELRNDSATPVKIAGWILPVSDADVKDTVLGMHGTLTFSVGSSITAGQPGGYVVIGNPTGTMATDAFVTLRLPNGTMIDDVEIGGLSVSRDAERDGVADGAPQRMPTALSGVRLMKRLRGQLAPAIPTTILLISMRCTPRRAVPIPSQRGRVKPSHRCY